MKIEKIYFDMDEVLADFNRGVRELCHMEPVDQSVSTKEEDDALWAAVRDTGHFYDRLKPVNGALEMFNALRDKYGEKCEILSAIPKPHRGYILIDDLEKNVHEWEAEGGTGICFKGAVETLKRIEEIEKHV